MLQLMKISFLGPLLILGRTANIEEGIILFMVGAPHERSSCAVEQPVMPSGNSEKVIVLNATISSQPWMLSISGVDGSGRVGPQVASIVSIRGGLVPCSMVTSAPRTTRAFRTGV